MDLETVGRRRISVGEILIDEKKGQRIFATKTEAETAATSVQIRQQPAFTMKIPYVFERSFESLVASRGARCNALAHQRNDAFDQAMLISAEAKVHVRSVDKIGNGQSRSLFAVAAALPQPSAGV